MTTQTSKAASRNARDDEMSDSMAEVSDEQDGKSSSSKQAADKLQAPVGTRSPQKKSMLRIMPISKKESSINSSGLRSSLTAKENS